MEINENIEVTNLKERTIGQQLAHELTLEEVKAISGGTATTASPDYTPTGKPEADCD